LSLRAWLDQVEEAAFFLNWRPIFASKAAFSALDANLGLDRKEVYSSPLKHAFCLHYIHFKQEPRIKDLHRQPNSSLDRRSFVLCHGGVAEAGSERGILQA
jgi:hypothetical protein